MFLKLFLLCCTVAVVLTAPPPPPPPSPPAPTNVVPLEKQQPNVIPIISQSEELEPNGTYKFSYETGNGIKREETSYDKVVPKARGKTADSEEGGKSNEGDDSDEIHVQQGSYSYVAPDGTVISVKYIADENGFQPIGDHIPKALTSQSVASAGEKSIPDSSGAGSAPAIATKSGFKPEPSKEDAKPESDAADSSKAASEGAAAIAKENVDKDTSTTPAAKEAAVTTEAASSEVPSTEAATALKSSETTISSETKESSASTEISTTEAASSTTIAPST